MFPCGDCTGPVLVAERERINVFKNILLAPSHLSGRISLELLDIDYYVQAVVL
jgi:hypothetical protein